MRGKCQQGLRQGWAAGRMRLGAARRSTSLSNEVHTCGRGVVRKAKGSCKIARGIGWGAREASACCQAGSRGARAAAEETQVTVKLCKLIRLLKL